MNDSVLSQAEIDAMMASAPPPPPAARARPPAPEIEEPVMAAEPEPKRPDDPLPPRSEPPPAEAPAAVKVQQARVRSEHRPAVQQIAPPAPVAVAPRPAPARAAAVDPAALRDITRRLQQLEQAVASLRRSGAPAKRVESQVRTLSGQVRALQVRLDDIERHLPRRRGGRAARRTLWSTGLYVEQASGGLWLN